MRDSVRQLLKEFPHHPWETTLRLVKSWVSVSLIGSLTGTVFDLSLVILLVEHFHFKPTPAAPLGLTLGSSVNFAVNKIFAFKDAKGSIHGQYFRFLGGTAVAAGVHAGLMYLFTAKLHIFYVISKLIADVLVFTVGNLILLKFIVFPEPPEEEARRAERL